MLRTHPALWAQGAEPGWGRAQEPELPTSLSLDPECRLRPLLYHFHSNCFPPTGELEAQGLKGQKSWSHLWAEPSSYGLSQPCRLLSSRGPFEERRGRVACTAVWAPGLTDQASHSDMSS